MSQLDLKKAAEPEAVPLGLYRSALEVEREPAERKYGTKLGEAFGTGQKGEEKC